MFRLRIERGTERATILDIFDTVQTLRNTGIYLKVDEEKWRIAQGSIIRGKPVSMVPACAKCQGYGSQILLMRNKNTQSTHLGRKIRKKYGGVSGNQRMTCICRASNKCTKVTIHPSTNS